MPNVEPNEKKSIGRPPKPKSYASELDSLHPETAKNGISGDITHRKTLEERLRASKADFRDIFDNTLLGLYRTTPDGRILMANPALLRMLGYASFDELAGRNLEDAGFEAGYPRSVFKERIEAEDKIVGLEAAWTRHDGTTLFVRESAKAVRDANGKVLYYAGTVEDITERKQAEEKLRLSEEKYRLLADNATDLIWTANMDLQLTYISPSVRRMRGFTVDEAISQTLEDMVAPSSIKAALKTLEEGLAEEGSPNADPSKVWTVELQVTHKNGPPIWTESTVAFIRDESGRPVGIRGASRDIAERKKAEEAMRDQEQRLELFFSQSLDGFFFMMLDEPVTWDDTVDKDKVLDYVFEHQRMTQVNDAMLEQYGASGEQFLGQTPGDFFKHDIDYGKEVWRKLFDTGRLHIETDERKRDGTQMWIEGDYICLYDDEGRITGHFGIQRDTTERRKALEHIEQSERRYRELFENMISGIAVYEAVDDGADFVFKDFNRTGESIDSKRREDLIGKRVTEVFPGIKDSGLLEVFKRVYKTGQPEFCPQDFYEDQRISGWRENRVYKLPTGEIVAIYNDITERKQIEDALRLDESRFEALLRLSQMTETPLGELAGFALAEAVRLTRSAIGFIGFLNEEETVMNVHAWSEEVMEQCGMKDKPLTFALDKAGIWADAVRLRKALIVNDYAAENPSKKGCPEGHIQLHRIMIVPVLDGNKVTAAMGVANKQEEYDEGDVRQLTLLGDGVWKSAQRIRAENELRASEEKYRFLFDAVPIGIGKADFEGNILACNRALEEMMGHGADELQSMNLKDIYASPDDRMDFLEAMKKQGRIRNWEYELTTNDGKTRSLLINADVVEREGRKVLLTTSRDITERKIAENALKKAHEELEGRVFQRTMELAGTNQELKSEITERRTAQRALAKELETSQRRQAEVTGLLQGSRVVLEHHTFEDAARKLFDSCKELTGATSGYVALLNDDTGENELLFLDPGAMACSVNPSLPMPIRGLREVAYRTGKPAYENSFADSEWMEFMPPGHVRLDNVLFAPLNIKGTTVGLLGLGNKPGGFNDADGRMAGAFAELAAVALNNSRTLGALRQSQKELAQARDHLEELVEERTAELLKTNRNLEEEIARRRKTGQELVGKQKQLKTLTSELALAEERERRRIAVGIHDNIGQRMALAKLELQSAMMSQGDSKTAESLQSVCARIDEAIKETHSLTFELSNPALYELSFDAAIEQWLLEQIQKKQNIKCEVTANSEPVELGINLKVVLFQTIRELAVNVVKYAGAHNLNVRIDKGLNRIVITMADDGIGFVPAETGPSVSADKGGFGLLNIRERLEHLGGGMKIQSAPRKGTVITLTVPLDRQDDATLNGAEE